MHQKKKKDQWYELPHWNQPVQPLFKKIRPADVEGDIFIGKAGRNFNIPFCLTLQDLKEKVLILGRSTLGKTNLMRVIQIGLRKS